MEYECNQGDYTFFGTPDGTATVLINLIGLLHDDRCITIIPNYLGGLNEQPDELKKPGQLVRST